MDNNFIKPQNVNPVINKFCLTIGLIPSSYLLSMTYEEQVLYIGKYLDETVIPALNNNAEAVAQLQELFTDLKNYVDNYFDNLDVQDEIDNKLDEMATNGTLANIINTFDIMQIIAPKFNPDEISSNYTIIKNDDKNILIDSSYANNWSNLKAMLDDNNVSHIDLFILTHYDADHAGCFLNGLLMQNHYIDSNTKLFLPNESYPISQTTINNVKALCLQYNLEYNVPDEGEIYNIGNIKITFTNCDTSQTENYYNQATDPNLYCNICVFEHKTNKFLFLADCDNKCLDLLKYNGIIKGEVDFITIPHHGFNATTNEEYLQQLKPKIAIQEAGSRDFARCSFTATPSVTTLYNLGCSIFPSFIQEDYIIINSNGFSLKVLQGLNFDTSNYLVAEKNIYVDISASNNNIQIGTQSNPYKELNQALSTIKNIEANTIHIHLADGIYNTNLGDILPTYLKATNLIQNINKSIIISGNTSDNTAVKIKGIVARNIKNLIVKNLTVLNDYRAGFNLINSNCYIDNCIITNSNQEIANYGIYCENGNVFVNSTLVNYATYVLYGDNANFRCRLLSVNNYNSLYPYIIKGNYIIQSIEILDDTKTYDKLVFENDYKSLRSIFVNERTGTVTSDDDEIELPVNLDRIKNLKLLLASSSNHTIVVDCRYPNDSKDFPVSLTFGSATFAYIVSCQIKFENDNKVKITNQQQLQISKSLGTITFSEWNNFHYFRILAAWIDDNY